MATAKAAPPSLSAGITLLRSRNARRVNARRGGLLMSEIRWRRLPDPRSRRWRALINHLLGPEPNLKFTLGSPSIHSDKAPDILQKAIHVCAIEGTTCGSLSDLIILSELDGERIPIPSGLAYKSSRSNGNTLPLFETWKTRASDYQGFWIEDFDSFSALTALAYMLLSRYG